MSNSTMISRNMCAASSLKPTWIGDTPAFLRVYQKIKELIIFNYWRKYLQDYQKWNSCPLKKNKIHQTGHWFLLEQKGYRSRGAHAHWQHSGTSCPTLPSYNNITQKTNKQTPKTRKQPNGSQFQNKIVKMKEKKMHAINSDYEDCIVTTNKLFKWYSCTNLTSKEGMHYDLALTLVIT